MSVSNGTYAETKYPGTGKAGGKGDLYSDKYSIKTLYLSHTLLDNK